MSDLRSGRLAPRSCAQGRHPSRKRLFSGPVACEIGHMRPIWSGFREGCRSRNTGSAPGIEVQRPCWVVDRAWLPVWADSGPLAGISVRIGWWGRRHVLERPDMEVEQLDQGPGGALALAVQYRCLNAGRQAPLSFPAIYRNPTAICAGRKGPNPIPTHWEGGVGGQIPDGRSVFARPSSPGFVPRCLERFVRPCFRFLLIILR